MTFEKHLSRILNARVTFAIEFGEYIYKQSSITLVSFVILKTMYLSIKVRSNNKI